MANLLHASVRSSLGKRDTRRLRKDGQIPAVLYGHGLENLNLAVSAHEIEAAIRHGAKLVDLQGDVADSALIKEVQWDTLGTKVLHVDFARVSAEEAVDVMVGIELVGDAPGTKEGGLIKQPTHELHIRCPAGAIPDKFEVRINALGLGQAIAAREIELPAGATLLSDPDAVVASCEEPKVLVEEEVAVAVEGEPEVIGRKPEEEEESEEE